MTEIQPHKYTLAHPSNRLRPFEGWARLGQRIGSPKDGDETACSPKQIPGEESVFFRYAFGNNSYELDLSGDGRQAAAPILVSQDTQRSVEGRDEAPGVDL